MSDMLIYYRHSHHDEPPAGGIVPKAIFLDHTVKVCSAFGGDISFDAARIDRVILFPVCTKVFEGASADAHGLGEGLIFRLEFGGRGTGSADGPQVRRDTALCKVDPQYSQLHLRVSFSATAIPRPNNNWPCPTKHTCSRQTLLKV